MNQLVRTLLEDARNALEQQFKQADSARRTSVDDAIEADGAMISRYDTFKEEAQYLAGGQNKRSQGIKAALNTFHTLLAGDVDTSQRVILGSLVALRCISRDEDRSYLIVPEFAGGLLLKHPETGSNITTISLQTPLGKTLARKEVGDEVRLPNSELLWEITELQ